MEYRLVTERIHLDCPNVHICFLAELTEAFNAEAVCSAVRKTMIKHPLLRSYVRMDSAGQAFAHIADHAEPYFEVKASSAEDWLGDILQEQEKPFNLERSPLFRVTLLGNMTLLICIHHILADGISGVKLLRDIAYFLNNPTEEAEPIWDGLQEEKALFPGEKLSLPLRLLTGWLNRRWRKAPHIFTPQEYHTMRQNYWKLNSHRIGAAALNQEASEHIVAMCRLNGVTVNTLLITTLLKCVQEIGGCAKPHKKTGLAISLHKSVTAIGNYASALSVEYTYNGKNTVWENTQAVQEQVRKKLGNERRKLFYLTFLKALDPNLIDSLYFVLFGSCKSSAGQTLGKLLGYVKNPRGFGITNLGRSDITHKDGIKTLYFVPPLVPSTDKIVGVISTDTGMRLVYQYDNHNADTHKRIFDKWIDMLQNL